MRITKSILYICHFCCLAFLLLQTTTGYSQVYGCKDPAANNYNPSATVNDGSCLYDTTPYTPVVKVAPMNSVLNETSGLQLAGNYLWSFNDGGGAAAIYRIDTLSNTLLQTVNLGGTTNGDWEDIGFDGTYLYIGAFGNNVNGARTDLRIYKLPLSAIPDHVANPVVTIPSNQIEVINFTYSDQPQPPIATTTNNTRFDCSAMIVDGGKIHLFSKNWLDVTTTHYVINGVAAGTYVAEPVETLPTNYLVTGADKAPGSDIVVLLGYQPSGFANHYLHFLSDYSGGLYFNGNKRQIDLPNAGTMGQAEGIVFRNSSYGYISNERLEGSLNGIPYTITQKLHAFNTNDFLPAFVLPLQLKSFGVAKQNGAHQVNWSFTDAVKELKVEWSATGTGFTTLQMYQQSKTGSFLHQPSASQNYYRLSWKGENGADKYSEIVSVNKQAVYTLSHLVLRHNGELTFRLEGNPVKDGTFRLLTVDGRQVAKTSQSSLMPGRHKISFSKSLQQHSVVLLEVISKEGRTSLLLSVQ